MAAQKVIKENNPKTAAIASETAAKLYGLEILEEGINDNKTNTTRFYYCKQKKMLPQGCIKDFYHVLRFLMRAEVLYTIFVSYDFITILNMTKIESRPIPEQPF